MSSDESIRRLTAELREEMLVEANLRKTNFLSMPAEMPTSLPTVWRVRFELTYDPALTVEFEVLDDVVIGRAHNAADVVALFPDLNTEQLGVSRKHLLFRPSSSVLYLIDLGSTNGTMLNGHPIGKHIPHPITNGDMISAGRLEFMVRILQQPVTSPPSTAQQRQEIDLVLAQAARAITTQLTLPDVIRKIIETARLFTPADEVSVWLVDEMTGQLYLEASYGMSNPSVVQMPVANTLAGEAMRLGKSQRSSRGVDGEPIKLKTGYMADGVIYAPLLLGQVQVGVVSVVHREPGKLFTDVDEKIMVAIADFAAVAIQNARLVHILRQDLSRRTKVVSALQYAFSHDVRQMLHSVIGYSSLLQSDDVFDQEETSDMLCSIRTTGEKLLELLERLVSMARLSQERIMRSVPCSLVEIASAAIENIREAAHVKAVAIQSQVDGVPYLIRGDANYLYLTIYNLLDNAIKFTPEGSEIRISLNFSPTAIIVRVIDQGPGIPDEELQDLFNRYFRSSSTTGAFGLGLGLEIVRATVEAHMGSVNAYNRKKGGAEFVVTLPASVRTDWPDGVESAQ
jgi:K+-sensing histidine kinase KdpD